MTVWKTIHIQFYRVLRGRFNSVDDMGTVFCKFDNGRSLGVIPGEDGFHTIKEEVQTKEFSEEPELDITM